MNAKRQKGPERQNISTVVATYRGKASVTKLYPRFLNQESKNVREAVLHVLQFVHFDFCIYDGLQVTGTDLPVLCDAQC